MKVIQRVAYYGAGFIVGLIILFFFLGGKKASCDYGFDSRTLKNIRSKKLAVTPQGEQGLKTYQMDSTDIAMLLQHGDVDFSETDRSLDSCKIYLVEGKVNNQSIQLRIENCNKTATIKDVQGK
ncbi:MAG: hypothetical protein R3359_04440 [Marinirhabdus sp.]|nr:hypothetical protein [Marinirhabdus sp.]